MNNPIRLTLVTSLLFSLGWLNANEKTETPEKDPTLREYYSSIKESVWDSVYTDHMQDWTNALVDTSYYIFETLPSADEVEQALTDLKTWANDLDIHSYLTQDSIQSLYEQYLKSANQDNEDISPYPSEIPVK